jgi:hypothetical protein
MTRPAFLEGAAVALVASLAGGAVHAALALVAAPGVVLRIVATALALAYLLYLLRRSNERIGRVMTLALWALATGALWLLDAPPLGFLCAQLGLVWLVRSLYFHAGVLAALADLGLVALGLAAAAWAASRSGSVALSLWCFFLVQACFVAIPARATGRGERSTVAEDRFARAHGAAEAAVRRLSSAR